MWIYLICPVRNATEDQRQLISDYVDALEEQGHTVHWPERDTNQDAEGIEICRENIVAISDAEEVHVWFDPDSKGSHFDMGAAFALSKKLVVVRNVKYGEGKSFPRMLDEWHAEG